MPLFQSAQFQKSVNLLKINALLLCFFIGNSQLSYCQESLRLACQNDDSEFIGETLDNSIVLKTGHFIPNVIPHDFAENVIFRAVVDGAIPTEIYLLIDGEQYPLESKGINDGAGPAGTIYEVEIAPSLILDKLVASDVFRVFVGFLEIYEGTQRVIRVNEFAQIWTPEIPVVPIKETANGIRYTSHVANIIMDINRDNSGSTVYQAASKKFYAEFEDRFDFLSLVLFQGYNANRSHLHIQNEVRNIGLDVTNFSPSWGSQGRLLGANFFPLPWFYDGATHAYSHEIGHQWINFLRDTPYESGIPHWPFCNHTHGIMGYSLAGTGAGSSFPNVLVQKENGYAFIPDTTSSPGKFFQDMDLYLMGLISAEDIEDKLIFKPSTKPVVNQVYPESDFTKYTKDDLIGDMGERIPDYTASQKDFNMATLLISAQPLSDIEMYFYDFFTQRAMAELPLAVHEGFLKEVANPFYVSTRGLAKLNTRLIECLNTESSISAMVCQGETYELNGQTYQEAGTFTQSLTNAAGCDSTLTLSLEVLSPTASSLSAAICRGETYELNGQTYQEAGTFTQSLTNAAGCDSTLTLSLDVLNPTASSISAMICQGETYELNGQTYQEAGTFTQSLTNAAGCDSTLTLSLDVLNPTASSLSAAICQGETYELNGQTYQEAGTFTQTLTNAAGCDSTITLNLEVQPAFSSTIDVSICEGESYTLGEVTYTQSGTFLQTFTAGNGCDSTIQLNLAVHPLPTLDLGEDLLLSVNDTIIITPTGQFSSYQWSDGSTGESLTIIGAELGIGVFEISLSVMNELGCSKSDSVIITVEQSTGVEEPQQALGILIYPNPTRGLVFLENTQNITSDLRLRLLDSQGRVLVDQHIIGLTTQSLDISVFPAGIYFLNLETQGKSLFFKLVHQ